MLSITRSKELSILLSTGLSEAKWYFSILCSIILIQQIASHIFPIPMVLLFNVYSIEASSCLMHVFTRLNRNAETTVSDYWSIRPSTLQQNLKLLVSENGKTVLDLLSCDGNDDGTSLVWYFKTKDLLALTDCN